MRICKNEKIEVARGQARGVAVAAGSHAGQLVLPTGLRVPSFVRLQSYRSDFSLTCTTAECIEKDGHPLQFPLQCQLNEICGQA
jgi:hypothetical protein